MSKKIEGRIFTPEEFRKLKLCITCGKAANKKKDKQCLECKAKDFKNCKHCEIILRSGLQKYYSYDTLENRGNEVRLKISVKSVIEFITEELPPYPQSKEIPTMCESCVVADKHWQERISNECFTCNSIFENTKENYLKNGNICEECVWFYSLENKQ